MKPSILYIIILLLFFGVSCTPKYSHPLLNEAAELLDTHPDSALTILQSINIDELSKDDQKMYYRLLLIEAKDKLYESPKNDKEIREVMDFFIDKKKEERLYPEIYYYAGRVYSELNEDAKALEYFDKALRCLKNKPDLSIENRIHAQKAGLYSTHNLGFFALKEIREHVKFTDSLYNNPNDRNHLKEKIGARLSLAAAYRQIGMSDSVWAIYNYLEEPIKNLNDSVMTSVFHSQLIATSIYEDNYKKADSLFNLHPFVYDYSSKASIVTITNEATNKLTDSILNKDISEELLSNPNLTIQYKTAKSLAERSRRCKNGEEVLKYAVKAHEIVEKIQKEYNENALAEMEKILDQTELENENLMLSLSNQKKEMWLIIAVFSILFLIAIIVIYHKHISQREAQNKLEAEKLKNENSRHIQDLEKEIAELRVLNTTSEQNLKAAEERETELQRKIEIKNEIEQKKQKEEQLEAELRLAKIREVILNKLTTPKAKVTNSDIANLRKAIALRYPSFFEELAKMKLPNDNVTDAMFIRLQLPHKLVASFLCKTPAAITNSRRRLFDRYCSDTSFETWKDFILALGMDSNNGKK